MNELQPTSTLNFELEDLVKQLRKNNVAFDTLSKRLEYIEKTQPVNPVITTIINNTRKQYILSIIGGRDSKAYRDKKLVSAIYRQAAYDFKRAFMISRYDLLRRSDQQIALSYWENWRPSDDLVKQIRFKNTEVV